MLWRCLTHVSHEVGFYIDIGANDPEIDSVTKIWYDHGWRGINLEPSPAWFARLQQDRPRDINIQAVVTDVPGHVTFHDQVAVENGSTVDAVTLTEICERHAPEQIHCLKVDVGGHEGAVLRGMDFSRFRPWVLVIEATEPDPLDGPAHEEWDQLVRDAGYTFAHTDVPSRYYVAEEHPELLASFALPADDYVRAQEMRRIAKIEAQLIGARGRIAALQGG